MTSSEDLQLSDASDVIGRQAFRSLLAYAEPLSIARIAEYAGVTDVEASSGLDALRRVGRVEFDDAGRLVGIFGLSLAPSKHRMELSGKTFFTWCAWDAVGIPAALGESATVTDECGHCGRELLLEVQNGRPPDLPIVVSWQPAPCESVKEQFCPTVNFFCNRHHLTNWAPAGYPIDAFLTLEQAAEEGVKTWGWARTGDGD